MLRKLKDQIREELDNWDTKELEKVITDVVDMFIYTKEEDFQKAREAISCVRESLEIFEVELESMDVTVLNEVDKEYLLKLTPEEMFISEETIKEIIDFFMLDFCTIKELRGIQG